MAAREAGDSAIRVCIIITITIITIYTNHSTVDWNDCSGGGGAGQKGPDTL